MAIPYSTDAEFVSDLETLFGIFMADDRPTEHQKAAAGRVAIRVLTDLGSIAVSLQRIAKAQEDLAEYEAVKPQMHR